MREKEESEETIETAYDNVVDEVYPYREPLEKLVYAVKRAAALAGIIAVCLYVTAAGEKDPEPEPKKILNIRVIDEFPPESELELRVLRGDYWKTESGKAAIRFNRVDDSINLRQEDGNIREESGSIVTMDTVQFFVPEVVLWNRSQREFDRETLRYAIHLYGVGNETTFMHYKYQEFSDTCADFNSGIDTVRNLVSEGYLNEQMTDFIDLFLQTIPYEQEYTLRLLNVGETLMESARDRWWHMEYGLYTKADTGEELMLASVYISKNILKQGEPQDDDTVYRIEPWMEGLWQFMEDPAKDMGDVWLQKVEGDSFANEESVRRFVEEQGASFLLPEGVDGTINWNYRRQEEFYYDYLICQGETTHYEVTLAIPLTGKRDAGYCLASVIRREAEDKETCHHMLSGMMQTIRDEEYLHIVKEGESLCKIAEKYMGSQRLYTSLQMYDEEEGVFIVYDDISNPDLIYPEQKVYVPLGRFDQYGRYDLYNAERALKYTAQNGE